MNFRFLIFQVKIDTFSGQKSVNPLEYIGVAIISVRLMCSAIGPLVPFLGGWPQIVCFWIHSKPSLFGLVDVDLRMLADVFPHVAFSTTVHDLGLTLDQELSFSEHVNLVTRSCYYQLRQLCENYVWCAPFPKTLLWSLCMPSSLAELITVAQSLLDVGLQLGLIGRLDWVLRYAARLIGHIPK